MNRRGFLGAIIAGLAFDPERLLWVPGKKLISVPKPRTTIGYLIREVWWGQGVVVRLHEPIFEDSFDYWYDRRDVELLSI